MSGARTFFTKATPARIRLFVTVRVPQVIPGVAEIQIRSESGDVRAIRVVPMRLAGPGSNLPPTPDLAVQSKDDPQFFTASLWLMESGALQVRVLVDGAQGQGEVSVPVPSSAQRTLPMQKSLAGLLLALMLLLAVGVVFIVGAIVREGNLEGGEVPSDVAQSPRAPRHGGHCGSGRCPAFSRQSLVGCERGGFSTPSGFLQASGRRAETR